MGLNWPQMVADVAVAWILAAVYVEFMRWHRTTKVRRKPSAQATEPPAGPRPAGLEAACGVVKGAAQARECPGCGEVVRDFYVMPDGSIRCLEWQGH